VSGLGFRWVGRGRGRRYHFVYVVLKKRFFFVIVEELVLVCLQELCPVLLRVNDVAVLLRRVSNNMCSK
jgi:hypothetical protein